MCLNLTLRNSSDRFVDVVVAVCLRGCALYLALRLMDIRSSGILVWSPADPDSEIDVGIQGWLFQIYPILLSTLLSIDRQQLSLFEAHFAISVSSSPLTLYLVVASIGDILRFKTHLYKRIKHRHTIRTSLILVPFLWFGLSMTLRLSSRAFEDSQLCDGSTFADWLKENCSFPTTLSALSIAVRLRSACVAFLVMQSFSCSVCSGGGPWS